MPIGLGIGLNICQRGGKMGGSGFSLDAPVATWTSAATVAQAIFGLEVPLGVVSGDQVYGEASVNSDVSSPFDTEIAAISAGDLIDLVIEDFAFAAFTDGLKYCRFCIKNAGGTQISAWSNIINRTIAVLPVLSSPTDVETGQTTADVGVTTDTAEGTLYCVVTTSSTPPTKAQVKLGQDNSGVAATYSANQAITTTGVKAFSATGLTATTAYTAHFMHEDVAGNQSTVSSGNGFTTSSSAATWNPSDKSANISLSNGNLTATGTAGGYQTVRATNSASSGKKYYEVTYTTFVGGSPIIGLANANQGLTTYLGNSDHNGLGMTEAAVIFEGDGTLGTGSSYAQGDVISIAFDCSSKKVWMRVNGGNWNNSGSADPATDTGAYTATNLNAGPYFPALSSGASGHALTANFGATAYAYAAPSGFGNW